MKIIEYNNINSNFTFESVCSQLTKFWINEVINLNKSFGLVKVIKIWLTIVVVNKNNRSFTLIKNLPFNTLGYTDVIIVIKQVFESNIVLNRQDLLYSIQFKFNFEYNKSYTTYSKYLARINHMFIIKYETLLNYILVLVLTTILLILFIFMYDFILTLDQVYREYITNVHKIRDEQLKWVLENRLGGNNSLNSISYNKLSKFVDLNLDWRAELRGKLAKIEVTRTILSELGVNFNSVVNSIQNTPSLSQSNLGEHLLDLRGSSNFSVSNPLGIHGITFHVDTAISMIDNFLSENSSVQRMEKLNYNSNLMYILVNKLSPSLY